MGTRQLAPCRSCAGALGNEQIAGSHCGPFTQGGRSASIQHIAYGVAVWESTGFRKRLIPDGVDKVPGHRGGFGTDIRAVSAIGQSRADVPDPVMPERVIDWQQIVVIRPVCQDRSDNGFGGGIWAPRAIIARPSNLDCLAIAPRYPADHDAVVATRWSHD